MDEISKRLIVVLGMHRSGTSTITRSLKVMGVELGGHLVPAIENNNSKGFWEDYDILGLNIAMLNHLKKEWYHLAPISFSDIRLLRKEGFFLQAVNLLNKKTDCDDVFGFKDPRVTKLLPFWKEVFDYCKLDVSYILAVRHPLSVIKSLANRDALDEEAGYFLWLGHVLPSVLGTNGNHRVVVDYDQLLEAPDQEIERIAKQLSLEVNRKELDIYKTEFLEIRLRHNNYTLKDLSMDIMCPSLVRDVYSTLLEVSVDKAQFESKEVIQAAHQWSDEFERLTPLLILSDRLKVQIINALDVVTEQENKINTLNQLVVEKNNKIKEKDNQLTVLTMEIDGIKVSRSWKLARKIAWVKNLFIRS